MKRMTRKNFNSKNEYTILEERRMLAGVTLETVNGFETIVIDGTNGDDIILVESEDSFSAQVSLNGEIFAFGMVGGEGIQRVLFLGREGNDSIVHNSAIDLTAYGHAGNDIIQGGEGHNRVQGGSGDDQIIGGDKNDLLRGREGNDTINGEKRHDRIFGGAGIDVIVAGEGNDLVRGEAGDDILSGLGGNDRIIGGAGSDLIAAGEGNDVVDGDEGQDIISGGDGLDRISGGADADDIDFGEGFGIAVYDSTFADFTAEFVELDLFVTDSAGDIDRLTNPNVISFTDLDVLAEDYSLELNEIESESFRLVNQQRAENSFSPLFAKLDLSNYAQGRAQGLADQLGANPTNFELLSAQSTLQDIEPLVNSSRTLYTENISFIPSQDLTPAEVASESHESLVGLPLYLSNMIYSGNTEFGIGIVESDFGWYVVQSFFVTN